MVVAASLAAYSEMFCKAKSTCPKDLSHANRCGYRENVIYIFLPRITMVTKISCKSLTNSFSQT